MMFAATGTTLRDREYDDDDSYGKEVTGGRGPRLCIRLSIVDVSFPDGEVAAGFTRGAHGTGHIPSRCHCHIIPRVDNWLIS